MVLADFQQTVTQTKYLSNVTNYGIGRDNWSVSRISPGRMGGILESNGDVYKELTETWCRRCHPPIHHPFHPFHHLSTTQDAFETKSGLMSLEKDVVFNNSENSYFVSPDTVWKIVLRKVHVLVTLMLDIYS